MKWKRFSYKQIREALTWAADGNIAVHDTPFPYKSYKHTAHLFAKDEPSLLQAARKLGMHPGWIQRRGPGKLGYTDHFDLFGARLEKAISWCE